ncbi:phosphatase 1 regulatory subunit 32-like [Brachionus plicatilis]|uniref:Phosphatase 1 regulatory subunit 32-like n=1 Tax=Brachionus plicatilis TaxID=10195 RepID=A0A3M7SPL5_BRAPC|nr:phosphatase 1 regulatory subunit 32-like [Brachionus plicatilis]
MAKPTPLPLGRANPHVLQSRGAEPYIMNFYSTSYSTSFIKANAESNKGKFKDIPAYTGEPNFKPRSAPLENKTGYTTNVRPQIYYNRNLDELDNPEMGRMLADNYVTITAHEFKPYKLNTGLEELPVKLADPNSAFTQNAYNHNPRPVDVAKQYLDTSIRAPYDVLPKHKAKLHQINDHNPISNENHGHGPFYMSTETSSKFLVNKKEEKMSPSVGPKEISGFVSNQEVEDVLTNIPGERWLFEKRPTGKSETHGRFQNLPFPRSETSLPNISNIEKTWDSTYVKVLKPSDINPKGLKYEKQTEYKETFLGKRDPEPLIHSNDQFINTLGTLRTMDPYQSRSIRANNRFYDDHSHDHKFTIQNKNVTFSDNNPYSVQTSSF